MKKVLLLAVVCLSVFALQAQEGFPDLSFGTGGSITVNPDISRIAPRSDGKVIGLKTVSPGSAFYRYNPDGSLDTSFGSGGIISSASYFAYSFLSFKVFAVQKDGKIIVGGDARTRPFFGDPGTFVYVLLRFHPDGTPDASFGLGGIVQENANMGRTTLQALAVQDDGKIVIAFQHSAPGGTQTLIGRYNANGTLDLNFRPGPQLPGEIAGPPGGPSLIIFSSHFPRQILIQNDGKILEGGISVGGGFSFTHFTRRNPDGTPDASFGNNGALILTAIQGVVEGIAVQPGGKIIAEKENQLYRFDNSGTLDPSFGSGGVLVSPFNVHQLLLQSDGKIITGGNFTAEGANGHFLLARYNPDGSFDPAFGYGGMMASAFRAEPMIVQSMNIANNRLYVYGTGILAAYQLNAASEPENTVSTGWKKATAEKLNGQKLSVQTFPNPATHYFTLLLQGSGREPVQVRIMDAMGRVVEVRRNIAPNSSLRIGDHYRSGLYYAEVMQGTEKITTKLVKGAK